jgi:hypothetical protein
MFTLIETDAAKASCQKRLQATIAKVLPQKLKRKIGFLGSDGSPMDIRSDGRYWFRSQRYDVDNEIPRQLNWFGLLGTKQAVEITVEINIPDDSSTRRVGGCFVKNELTGMYYLAHSGKIGGGAKGVGKMAFLAWSRQTLVQVSSSLEAREVILVMPLTGLGAEQPLYRYVDWVADFKQAVRMGKTTSPAFAAKLKAYEAFYYVSRHGDVVSALGAWRKAKGIRNGFRLTKNIYIDMGVGNSSKLSELFEVKTSTARSDLYGAIGQLSVHAQAATRCFLVVPSDAQIPSDVRAAVKRLEIGIILFEIDSMGAVQIK